MLLILVKNYVDAIGKKLYSCVDPDATLRSRLIRMPLVLLSLILATQFISTIVGLGFVRFPRLFTISVIAAIAFPTGFIVLIILMRILSKESKTFSARTNAGMWLMALCFAAVALLLSVALGFFDGADWLPKRMRAKLFPDEVQFPLSSLTSFTIDEKGTMYFGIQPYERIQVYDPKGRFLRAWFIDAGEGLFDIWIEDTRLLHVFVYRTDAHLVFAATGELLDKTHVSSLQETNRLIGKGSDVKVIDGLGRLYTFENKGWYPKLIRINDDGTRTQLYKDPWYLFVLRKQVPLLALTAAAIVNFGVLIIMMKHELKRVM